jgi:hypothetical protein
MILLISPYHTATDCAAQIESAAHAPVKTVSSIRLALAALRTQDFEAVVVDENLLEATPGATDSLVQRMGTGTPVFLDMACMKPQRVAKMVSIALRRRELEHRLARTQAAAELRSALKSDITGLLISSRIALDDSKGAPHLDRPLTSILEIANRIKERLEMPD